MKEPWHNLDDLLLEHCSEDGANLPNKDDLLKQLNQLSHFPGHVSSKWLQMELCINISLQGNDCVSIIRRFRQEYLFNAFLEEYFVTNKSSFIMDNAVE